VARVARVVHARHGALHGAAGCTRRARWSRFLERAKEHREPLLPLEPLAARGETSLDVVAFAREEQEDGELGPEDRHARVLEVAVALVDQLREVGDDARPVAADRREREPAPHRAVR